MMYAVDVHHLKFKQEKYSMYNATLWRFRATTVAVKTQYVLQILCVSVALRIQQAMRMRHIVICGLPRSKTYFHTIS